MLVCGERYYGRLPQNYPMEQYQYYYIKAQKQRQRLTEILDQLKLKYDIEYVVHGCAKGADSLGEEWAIKNSIPAIGYRALWDKEGKAAGILRNQRMLDEEDISLVVAFPGSTGTRDMIARSKKAGIPVLEIK